MADIEYLAGLDNRDVLLALERIKREAKDTATVGNRAFNTIGDNARLSGVSIGLTAGFVQELTRRFIDLGLRAADIFGQIAVGSLELNKNLELTEISLTAIFEGNEKAAQAFIQTIDKTAALLGSSRQELRVLGKSILPDVGDIANTVDIIEKAVVLGREAGQNLTGVRIALEETLASGGRREGLISLRRRLNIPPQTIDRLVELSKQIGIGAALAQVLGERVQKAGIDAQNFTETFEVGLGQMRATLQDLSQIGGLPFFDEAKEQLFAIKELFAENQDDIDNVAEAFGFLAARITEIFGTGIQNFLENADFQEFQDLADNLTKTVNSANTLVKVLSGGNFDGLIAGSNTLLENLQSILDKVTRITAEGRAGRARNDAEAAVFAKDLENSFAPQLGADLAKVLGPEAVIGAGRLAENLHRGLDSRP